MFAAACHAADLRGRHCRSMALSVGIVGLPNVGKSTVFNALTAGKAEAANYPFCTIDPNVGVVPVPDERLGRITEAHPDPEDHPGDRRDRRHRRPRQGRVAGRGPGQQVPREHPRDQRDPDDGALLRRSERDPRRRLGRSDARHRHHRSRAGARRRRDRREAPQEGAGRARRPATRTARSSSPSSRRSSTTCRPARPCARSTCSDDDRKQIATWGLLTAKPVLYCCNVGEGDLPAGNAWSDAVKARAEGRRRRRRDPVRQGRGRARRARPRRTAASCCRRTASRSPRSRPSRASATACSACSRTSPPARRRSARGPSRRARTAPRGRRRDPHRLREGLHPRPGLLARRSRAATAARPRSRPPASCAWKARSTSSRTATSCTSCSTSDVSAGRAREPSTTRGTPPPGEPHRSSRARAASPHLVARTEERPHFVEAAAEIELPALETARRPSRGAANSSRHPASVFARRSPNLGAVVRPSSRSEPMKRIVALGRRSAAEQREERAARREHARELADHALDVVEQHEREVTATASNSPSANGSSCALPCTAAPPQAASSSRDDVEPDRARTEQPRELAVAAREIEDAPRRHARREPLVAATTRERSRGDPWPRLVESPSHAPLIAGVGTSVRYRAVRSARPGLVDGRVAAASWGTWSLFLRPTGLPAIVTVADHVRRDGRGGAAVRAARPAGRPGTAPRSACCSRTPRSTRSTCVTFFGAMSTHDRRDRRAHPLPRADPDRPRRAAHRRHRDARAPRPRPLVALAGLVIDPRAVARARRGRARRRRARRRSAPSATPATCSSVRRLAARIGASRAMAYHSLIAAGRCRAVRGGRQLPAAITAADLAAPRRGLGHDRRGLRHRVRRSA